MGFGGLLGATQLRARSSGARLETVYTWVPTIVASLGWYFGGVSEHLGTLSNVKYRYERRHVGR